MIQHVNLTYFLCPYLKYTTIRDHYKGAEGGWYD